ncbi:MAG TPA: HipA domain-containing protein [Verrucomicrobiae bacterium]|nr:HipA domain-containing protein [Verrucomicrobiae bacterium]
MNRCLITYDPMTGPGDYSAEGLRLLNRNLTALQRLEFSAEEQRQEAIARAGKMSIQGVQPKLSAVLKIKEGRFDIVDRGGTYILKPAIVDYPEVPQNEDLTMRLAKTMGIEVPVHGLIYGRDDTLTYFIQRFDRQGRAKIPVEDFAQLSGESRETKYNSSMEKVVAVIDEYCTFPVVERVRLFERVLFNFLVGNEDMHLKNYALITRNRRVELAPAFDFLSTCIAIKNPKEEIALPLNGKKSGLSKKDVFDYFGRERLEINEKVLAEMVERLQESILTWPGLIQRSFLSAGMQESYETLLTERIKRLGLVLRKG